MSEETVSVDDVLQAIQQKNVGRAKAMFQNVMSDKINSSLESEKVRIASQVFNAPEEAEVEEPEYEEETDDEEVDVESEVSNLFDEDDETE
jgi:hypothetical protein